MHVEASMHVQPGDHLILSIFLFCLLLCLSASKAGREAHVGDSAWLPCVPIALRRTKATSSLRDASHAAGQDAGAIGAPVCHQPLHQRALHGEGVCWPLSATLVVDEGGYSQRRALKVPSEPSSGWAAEGGGRDVH